MKSKTRLVSILVAAFIFSLAFQLRYHWGFDTKGPKIRFFVENQQDSAENERISAKDSVQMKFESNTNVFMETMKTRMQKRQERIKDVCETFGLQQKNMDEIEIILARKYKLAYCPIPKTGCSNMKRLMLALNGFGNKSDEVFPMKVVGQTNLLHQVIAANYTMRSLGMPEFVKSQGFTKLLVVRHPFERALSAYNNKLVNEQSGTAQFHKRAQKMRMTYGSKERQQADGDSPTFEEFVSYLKDANNTNRNGEDNHWNSFDVICQPCRNVYDVIVKIETIEEDLRYLMLLIGAPPHLTIPAGYSKTGKSRTDRTTLTKFFGSLSKAKVDDLFQVYKTDFLSYGYAVEDIMSR